MYDILTPFFNFSNDSVREEANRGIIITKAKSEVAKKTFYPKYGDVCAYFFEKVIIFYSLNSQKAFPEQELGREMR